MSSWFTWFNIYYVIRKSNLWSVLSNSWKVYFLYGPKVLNYYISDSIANFYCYEENSAGVA